MLNKDEKKDMLDLDNQNQLIELSKKLDCSLEELNFCISKVGKAIPCIEMYLTMNRDLIEYLVYKDK